MIMVVFGAGASYDSNPSAASEQTNVLSSYEQSLEAARMPLANELFQDREMFDKKLSRYPRCHPIVPYLRLTNRVEQILQGFLNEVNTDPKRHQQLAAIQYYLHDMIWECEDQWLRFANNITNHITLLDQLRKVEKDGICLVTFNYDRLIEHALRSVDVDIREIPDYVSHKNYKLIKLHGSIDWAHEVENLPIPLGNIVEDNVPREIIDQISETSIKDNYQIVDKHPMTTYVKEYKRIHMGEEKIYDRERVALYPAIAIPVQRKNNFECPPSHVNILKEMIPTVDKILVIGWRATEIPFLKLKSDNLVPQWDKRKCLVVTESNSSSLGTIKNLEDAGVKAAYENFDSGFSTFVLQKKVDEFLS